MKVELISEGVKSECGDIIILHNGAKYLVIESLDKEQEYVNLTTMKSDYWNDSGYQVGDNFGSSKIAKIIKSNRLVLKEI